MAFGLFSIFAALGALVLIACGIALLPALLVIGAIALAFGLIAGVLGFALRLVGGLLLLLLALPLMIAGVAIVFALGVAILHAALPLLLVIGVVWLIVRHPNRSTTPAPIS